MINVISTKLRDIRENNDISQRKLSQILNISKSNYNRWETQEKIIPLERLKDFCNYFSVSMDYIFDLNKNNNYSYIDNLDKISIGKKLKEIRIKINVTQKELAIFLNTTHSTISAYENGKTLILTAFLYQICKKYNVSMDTICDKNKRL